MTAFRKVLQPLLLERCGVNPNAGSDPRAVTHRTHFAHSNVGYCARCIRSGRGGTPEDGHWFSRAPGEKAIQEVVGEADRLKGGRLQWRGLYSEDWERAEYVFETWGTHIVDEIEQRATTPITRHCAVCTSRKGVPGAFG